MPFVGCFQTGFNTQPPEGGWWARIMAFDWGYAFQHTAARRRLVSGVVLPFFWGLFQHTAARRRLGPNTKPIWHCWQFQHTAARRRLALSSLVPALYASFNTQPPEGGWTPRHERLRPPMVSTHSRPKAAGHDARYRKRCDQVSTHSRPKAAGSLE